MNPLLGQFLSEARDLLDEASGGFLALEQDPANAATVNTVFRAVHTIKGGSGLFEFGAITRLVHAAEDVLDGVRQGEIALSNEVVDLCLVVVDRVGQWLDAVEQTEALPADADTESARVAAQLRALLPGARPAAGADGPAVPGLDLAWVRALPAAARAGARAAAREGRGVLGIDYRPQEHCFFGGEDPFSLVRQVPGLLALDVVGAAGADEWPTMDPFRCTLGFRAVAAAARDDVDRLFQYVPDEVRIAAVPADLLEEPCLPDWLASVPDSHDREVFAQLVAEQDHILGLPCEAAEWDARLASVTRALRNGVTYLGADEPLAELDAASAAAAASRSFAPLRAAISAWQPRRPAPLAVVAPATAEDAAALGGEPLHTPAVEPSDGGRGRVGASRALKVDQAKVDQLMTLIGEMVVAKNALPYLARRAEQVFGNRELAREIKEQHATIHRITEDLHRAVMQVRMMPVGSIFQRFPRLVRDLARKLDKQIDLVLEGEETEADKNVIEALADPLIHLVRNSADHGIEPADVREAAGKPAMGTIRLRAVQASDRVVIEVADDGAGIDPERVRRKAVEKGLLSAERASALGDREAQALVLAAGFSTREAVSDLSGRGVGLDVVRAAVEAAGGSLELDSVVGQGTTVRLGLPLTMAVTTLLVVDVAGETFGVPIDAVVETLRVPVAAIRRVKQDELLVWRGQILPVRRLAAALGGRPASDAADAPDGELSVLVARIAGDLVALVVSGFEESTDVIVKPLAGVLAHCRGYAGTAILGDGRVLLVLSLEDLV